MNKDEALVAFKEKKLLLLDFRNVLCPLLEEILESHNINYAFVRGRVKSEESIEGNFKGNQYKDSMLSGLHDIRDLIGCRIVFYLSEDQSAFLDVVRKEFKIVDERRKESVDEYQGYHLLCKLTSNRVKLSEYNKYKDIPFEMQLTTVLHHGWNELDHDIFYKDKAGLGNNHQRLYSKLKNESRQIMQKFLIPAQHAWEALVNDYKSAQQNQVMYSPEYLRDLADCSDNNKIFWDLTQIKDKTSAVGLPENLSTLKVVEYLKQIIVKSKKNKVKRDEGLLGYLPGKDSNDIAGIVLDLIKPLFYLEPKAVIGALFQMYLNTTSESVRTSISEALSQLATFKNDILTKHGFVIQYLLLEAIKKLTPTERAELIDPICNISESVFATEFSDNRDFFDNEEEVIKITHTNYSFKPGDEKLGKLQKKYIDLLKRLYRDAGNFIGQVRIINALSRNMHTDNSNQVVNFLLSLANKETDVEILSKIEDALTWVRDKTLIDKLNHKIIDNKYYKHFRVLVGYDRNFDLEMSWSEASSFRAEKINELVRMYADKKHKKLVENLVNLTFKSYGKINDASAYIHFNNFLHQLISTNPQLGLKLVNQRGKVDPFVVSAIVAGLLDSKLSQKEKKELIEKLCTKNSNTLAALAQSLRKIENKNLRLYAFTKILSDRSVVKTKSEESAILTNALCSLGFNETNTVSKYLKAFDLLAELNDFRWVGSYYGAREDEETVFAKFKAKEWDRFLKGYVMKEQINFHDNYILEMLSEKYPKKIIGFFKKRIELETRFRGRRNHYSAIPYDDRRLHEIFSKHADIYVDEIFKWFNEFESWKVGHVLHGFYPSLPPTLEKRLFEVIDKKDKKLWQKKVASLFSWYESYAIEGVIQYTIKKFGKDKDIWNSCICHLVNPGSVGGLANEPIVANAIERKLNGVKKWKQNTKKMKEFIAEVEKYAVARIESEKVSHNKEILGHKRDYS